MTHLGVERVQYGLHSRPSAFHLGRGVGSASLRMNLDQKGRDGIRNGNRKPVGCRS